MTNKELSQRARKMQQILIDEVMKTIQYKTDHEVLDHIDDAIREFDVIATELETRKDINKIRESVEKYRSNSVKLVAKNIDVIKRISGMTTPSLKEYESMKTYVDENNKHQSRVEDMSYILMLLSGAK